MKKFTIEISGASAPQLQTIAAELKIMANNWERFGPRIFINKQAVEPPELHIPGSNKRATETTSKRHKLAMFI